MTIPCSSRRSSSGRNRSPHTILYPNWQIPPRITLIRRISLHPLKPPIRERAAPFNLRVQSLPIGAQGIANPVLAADFECVV
jgi:hypothetical protein